MARFCGLASARANPDRAAAMANALQSGTSVQLSTGAAERLTFAAGTTMGSLPAAVTSTDERTGRVALFAGYLLERPAGENHAEMLLSCCEDDACLAALNGIFAAAVWDPRDDTLVLVTDRWGMRPLYWAHVEDGIAFGSSIRSVVAAGVDADLDVHALEETLGAGFALGQRTLWSAVRRVEPATRLTMRGRSVGTTHYWRWPAAGDERVEDVGFVEGAAAIFRNTIDELARRTERPVCLLSAGYDSRRIVLALAGAGANAEAYTASAPFAQRYTIDVPVAVEVCRRLGLSITTTPLPTPHETDRMAEAAGALLDYETEEGVLLMPLLSKLPAGGTNFDGIGGDRLLGDFFYELPMSRVEGLHPTQLARRLFPTDPRSMLTPDLAAGISVPFQVRASAAIGAMPSDPNRFASFLMRTRMRRLVGLFGCNLLEARVDSVFPYLDTRLADYVLRFDPALRAAKDMQGIALSHLYPEFDDVPTSHDRPEAIDGRYLQPIGDWAKRYEQTAIVYGARRVLDTPDFADLLAPRIRRMLRTIAATRFLGKLARPLHRRAWIAPRLGRLASWYQAARDPQRHADRIDRAVKLFS